MERGFLAQCEQEPLHLSGAIQDHGTLLAVAADGRVTHAAANIGHFLGAPPQDWIGRPLPPELAAHLQALPPEPGSRRALAGGVDGRDGALDLCLNRGGDGACVLEFTAHDPRFSAAPPTATIIEPFADDRALAATRRRLLQAIGTHTAARRVLYYAFLEQGDGEVIDEVRQGEDLGSYLGLRFPASDIPQIARALYLKNPWRLIVDARREPVALLGHTAQAPDLTWSDLRSVSPVHRIYLANMGVAGSLSLPVVSAGQLVALITAHHHQALQLAHGLLEALADEVKAFALALTAYAAQCRMRLIDSLSRRFEAARAPLRRHGDLYAAWPEVAPLLLSEFQADGAMLCNHQGASCVGRGLEPGVLERFDTWFGQRAGELVWTCDSLSRTVPDLPLTEIAGVLALRLDGAAGHGPRVYLTRGEHIHEVAWGGNPDKPAEFHDGKLGIAPRRSFEKWVEKRLGYSRPWRNEDRLLALKLRELLLSEVRA